jgi:Uma2 family endonuclease
MDTTGQHRNHDDMVDYKSMTTADSTPRRLTVEEYDKMAEAGIFGPDERVELVEGSLVSYAPPQGENHAGVVWQFPEVMRGRLGTRVALWTQLPLIISKTTVLEPDVAILRLREGGYRHHRPVVADTYAVVEIAKSSLARDRTQKLRLYASAGIPEYWVVDVSGSQLEMYRQPSGDAYVVKQVVSGSDNVSFEAFPDVVFTVDELLG